MKKWIFLLLAVSLFVYAAQTLYGLVPLLVPSTNFTLNRSTAIKYKKEITSAPLEAKNEPVHEEEWKNYSSKAQAAQLPELYCQKKRGEVNFQGKRFVRYRLRADHFPEGNRFNLCVKWFNGEEAETFDYIANRKGHLVLSEKREDPLYALCPLKRGERIQFVMRSRDDPKFFKEASIVPFPMEMISKSRVHLSLELQGQWGEFFLLQGSGFIPNEKVEIYYELADYSRSYALIASEEGDISLPVSFDKQGFEGGLCTLKCKRASEEIYFPFHAGKEALEIVGGFVLEIR